MSPSPCGSTPFPYSSHPTAGSPRREQQVGAQCWAEGCQCQHSVQPGQGLDLTVVPLRTRWGGTLLDDFCGIFCLWHPQMPWRSMKSTWTSAGRPSPTTSAKTCCAASRPRTLSAAAVLAKPGARTVRSVRTGPPVSRVVWAGWAAAGCAGQGWPCVAAVRAPLVCMAKASPPLLHG